MTSPRILRFYLFIMLYVSFTKDISAQKLQPGFIKHEYEELLKINQKVHIDFEKWKTDTALPMPMNYKLIHRSNVVGFDNRWDFWANEQQPIGVIAIRGSILTQASFLANFYAAMIPAKGELQLSKEKSFTYQLATHPNAAVQAGWLIAMAHVSESIIPTIDSAYKKGMKDFLITGHSQGGGIAFMLTAYLRQLQLNKELPTDIQFKTYCSAGPKPGNLFFAYEYEKMTQGGWAFNVVNTADWVPDVPFSIQTTDDFTEVNPFPFAKDLIKQQKFPKNVALKHVYNQLSKPAKKAQRKYEQYLGKMVSKAVAKQLPEFQSPAYYKSNYFVRTGQTIVLYADNDYILKYQQEASLKNIWLHHMPDKYAELLKKY